MSESKKPNLILSIFVNLKSVINVTEIAQFWHKRSLGLEEEPVTFWWSKVSVAT